MKIEVPVIYKGIAVVGKSATPKEEVFVEVLPFEIRELTSSEVPVALRYFSDRAALDPRVHRYVEDTFLNDVNISGGGRTTVKDFGVSGPPSLLIEAMGYVHGTRENTAIWDWYRSTDKGKVARDPARARDWFSSDRDQTIATVEDVLAKTVAVDGVLWYPGCEPTIGILDHGAPVAHLQRHPVDYSNRNTSYIGHPIHSPAFNLNDLDELEAYSLARFGAFQPGGNYDRRFEVTMPEAFVFDRGRHALDWAARDLFDSLSAEIKSLEDRHIAEWQALRRIVNAERSHQWEQDAARTVAEMIPLLLDFKRRRMLQDMVEIWADNDISIDLSNPSTGPC